MDIQKLEKLRNKINTNYEQYVDLFFTSLKSAYNDQTNSEVQLLLCKFIFYSFNIINKIRFKEILNTRANIIFLTVRDKDSPILKLRKEILFDDTEDQMNMVFSAILNKGQKLEDLNKKLINEISRLKKYETLSKEFLSELVKITDEKATSVENSQLIHLGNKKKWSNEQLQYFLTVLHEKGYSLIVQLLAFSVLLDLKIVNPIEYDTTSDKEKHEMFNKLADRPSDTTNTRKNWKNCINLDKYTIFGNKARLISALKLLKNKQIEQRVEQLCED